MYGLACDLVDIEEKERADRATERRRDMLGQRIKRFVFLFIRETKEVYLFSQSLFIIFLDHTLWKNARTQRQRKDPKHRDAKTRH